MKKRILRPLALVLAIALITSALAGCNRNNDGRDASGGAGGTGTAAENPDYVFVPEFITLPGEIMDMSNLIFSGERLYFSSWYWSEETGGGGNKLFSMYLDGTDLMELPNYSAGNPPEGAMGHVNINALSIDGDGNLWVAESGQFWGFDVPEGREDIEPHEMWQYQYEIGQIIAVRKLDRTGAELLSVDISNLQNHSDDPFGHFWISGLNIDGNGNIYIASGNTIFVLNGDGVMQFSLDDMSWVERLVRLPDGTIAHAGFMETGFGLRTINFAGRTWGEEIELPSNARVVFPGGGEYDIVFSDGSNLFGIEADTGESVKLLNWIDSDMQGDDVISIAVLPDGRVMVIGRTRDAMGMGSFELALLTRVPFDSVPESELLTLAAFGLDWNLRGAIVHFNRTNGRYRIQVTDYMDLVDWDADDAFQAGLTRMTTEIISGRVPDIIAMSPNLPFHQYVARGLLVDLYPFIDADPELSRSGLVESAFRTMEVGGSLYQIFPIFTINTLIGHPSVVGENMGWTMSEFYDVLRANPQADAPLGSWMTRGSFLQQIISVGMDDFVDWTAGTSNFDSDSFIKLLEVSNMFPEEIDFDSIGGGGSGSMAIARPMPMPEDLIATGRQIVVQEWISDFSRLQVSMAQFGGYATFKGFPTDSGSGHALQVTGGLALTSAGGNQQGAWNFIRTILNEDWQRTNVRWNGFPTNRAVFDELLEEAMTPQYWTDMDGNEVEMPRMTWGTMGGITIEIFAMTQDEADHILSLIDAVSGPPNFNMSLMNIISEGAEDFFSGRRSAQDAARIIQSRASILIAEQS